MNAKIKTLTSFVKRWLKTKGVELSILSAFFVLLTCLVLYKVVFISNMSFDSSFWAFYGIVATTFLLTRLPHAYLFKDDHIHQYTDSEYPSVTVIIAAKNEEEGIFRTIETCVNSQYPSTINCMVIDDGSTDGTANEILRAVEKYGKEKIQFVKFPENKGKREAMAVGMREAKNDIIIFVDSDTFLAPDGIKHITEHFLEDERIGAVSGNTMVENVDTCLLTRMQSIQYAVSFNMYKASESVYGAVTCCPGCFSAYRSSAVKPLIEKWKNHKFFGSQSTFGDDRGLTNYVLRDWRIVYCEKAKATTTVPEKISVYLKQQLRWKKSWIREGLFAASFMWRKTHPLASWAFYVNFSFPILAPMIASYVLYKSIVTDNLFLFAIFVSGFVLLGAVFALFVRVYFKHVNWIYMPIFSILFITVFIWQMPYAILTLNKTSWGTR